MKRPCGSTFFNWQVIRNLSGVGNDENKNTLQVYYIREPLRKTESHIGNAYDTFVTETAGNLWSEHHSLHSMSQRIRRSMR
jgi:hypothetical protein